MLHYFLCVDVWMRTRRSLVAFDDLFYFRHYAELAILWRKFDLIAQFHLDRWRCPCTQIFIASSVRDFDLHILPHDDLLRRQRCQAGRRIGTQLFGGIECVNGTSATIYV